MYFSECLLWLGEYGKTNRELHYPPSPPMLQTEYLSFDKKILAPTTWSMEDWQQNVPAWIRNYYFFVPGVDNVELLKGIYELALRGISEFCKSGVFVCEVMNLQKQHLGHTDISFAEKLYEDFLIWHDHEYQVRCFTEYFSDGDDMFDRPALGLTCRNKSRVLNPRHAANLDRIQLASDLDFWISLNREEDGGYGRPYGPFEKYDQIHTSLVHRSEAVLHNLLGAKEEVDLTPAERERWCLPLVHLDDFNNPERLEVVEQLKQWDVWHVRSRILEKQSFRQRVKRKPRKIYINGKELSSDAVRDLIYKRTFGMTYTEYIASSKDENSMIPKWLGAAVRYEE